MVEAVAIQAVAVEPRGRGAGKRAIGRGTTKLNEAADKTLQMHSDAIAESLYERFIKGNVTCAKLLIALADGRINCEDEVMVRSLCNLAERLGSEQKWHGELDEADAESGG
jgi:hypothetical protein